MLKNQVCSLLPIKSFSFLLNPHVLQITESTEVMLNQFTKNPSFQLRRGIKRVSEIEK